MRIAQDNDALTGKFHNWTCRFAAVLVSTLPHTPNNGCRLFFGAARLATPVCGSRRVLAYLVCETLGDDVKNFRQRPDYSYCGNNRDFEAVRW